MTQEDFGKRLEGAIQRFRTARVEYFSNPETPCEQEIVNKRVKELAEEAMVQAGIHIEAPVGHRNPIIELMLRFGEPHMSVTSTPLPLNLTLLLLEVCDLNRRWSLWHE